MEEVLFNPKDLEFISFFKDGSAYIEIEDLWSEKAKEESNLLYIIIYVKLYLGGDIGE